MFERRMAFPGDTMQLKVTLQEIEPEIWRRILVPADAPLSWVHEALQIAFGWQGYHLHDFLVGDVHFGMADIEDEVFCVDERTAPIGAVARVGSSLVYQYDFGDSWQHDVLVEEVQEGSGAAPAAFTCLGGARACPPEDCGGTRGYADLLAALRDVRHPEHVDMKRWAGRRFDAERFDLAAARRKLATLTKKYTRTKRAAKSSAQAALRLVSRRR